MSEDRPRTETGGPVRLLIVTGMSGAGKTTALATLDDWGWEIVDNLPVDLVADFVAGSAKDAPIAIGLDARSRGFDPLSLPDLVARIDAVDPELLYLDCDDDEIVRRYDATRRRHPLAREAPAEEGIARERVLTAPLRDAADSLIDASQMSPAELREELEHRFGETAQMPLVTLSSFGFSRGLPKSADLMFDMRFLKNPYWEPNLRDLTGRDGAIIDYVSADPGWPGTMSRIETLLDDLIPRYWAAGKNYLTVAFGCTGGRHRSVAAAEEMARRLSGEDRKVAVRHRDLPAIGDEAK